MNNRIVTLLLACAFLVPCTINADAVDQLIAHLIRYVLTYPSRLQKRRDMPETKEEYFKRIEIGATHVIKHLKNTIEDDYDWGVTGPMMKDLEWEIQAKWKKTWWDRNPGLGDLICVSSIVTVLGVIVAVFGDNAQQRGNAGAPANAGNNQPNQAPPAYGEA